MRKLRTRGKSYKDYGFEYGEANRLKEYCRQMGEEEREVLKNSAISTNPTIADELYESLVNGKSYDKQSKTKYIPIPRPDFYGYQRKCLSVFRNFLLLSGKWE